MHLDRKPMLKCPHLKIFLCKKHIAIKTIYYCSSLYPTVAQTLKAFSLVIFDSLMNLPITLQSCNLWTTLSWIFLLLFSPNVFSQFLHLKGLNLRCTVFICRFSEPVKLLLQTRQSSEIGYYVITWLPHYSYHFVTSYGYHIVTTWLPHGYHMVTTWLPHSYHMVTTCLPHGYHMVTS